MKKIILAIFVLTLTACKPDEIALNGYVEGEYLYIAPTTSGILRSLLLNVARMLDRQQNYLLWTISN